LGIPGEKEFMGKGVSYCAICDGPLFKNKNIVVVGCGNSGIQEGLFLLKFVNHITFIEFLDYMTASPMLQERIKKERVDILLNYEILRINGDARVTGVTVRDRKTGETKIISAQGVFIYVGVTPNTQWLRGMVDLDSDGYIITNDKLETSISGVFAVGDVRKKSLPFFQIISAASDGAFAVFAAEKYLLS
jgi:thioredoxin reductase (NADPH)